MQVGLVSSIWLPFSSLKQQTTSKEILLSFVLYHKAIGIAQFWLFVDDTSTNFQFYQDILNLLPPHLRSYVHLIHASTDFKQNEYPHCTNYEKYRKVVSTDVAARQVLHAEYAMKQAQDQGIDWILHLDIDELYYIPSNQSLENHLSQLKELEIEQVIYPNHEAIAHNEAIGNYFVGIQYFKKHHCTLPLHPGTRQAFKFWTDRTTHNQYLLFYDNGKALVRVQSECVPESVHRWHLPQQKPTYATFIDPRQMHRTKFVNLEHSPAILHYPICGYNHFVEKYHQLGDFGNNWTLEELPMDPCFHRDARDVCRERVPELMKQFYRAQVFVDLETEQSQLQLQCQAQVVERITEPRTILTKVLEPFLPQDSDMKVSEEKASQRTPSQQLSVVNEDNSTSSAFQKAWIVANAMQTYL